MTDGERIERIRTTWALAAADSARTGRVFYSNLFRIDSSTKPLFVGDLDLQAHKLTQTLSFIVDHLDDMEMLLPAATDLAKRHLNYGIKAEQYTSVGTALIETFKQLLGPAFTLRDQTAWGTTYTALCDIMIKAAYGD
ncbi:MAG: globin domain-containing protein [Pseudomonadota bacterium]